MKPERRKRRKSRVARVLKWTIALGVIGGLIGLAFKPRRVEIDTQSVGRGEMILTVGDDGETRVRERYGIAAPLAGQLLRIRWEPGDRIRKGEVLAIIAPGPPNLLDPRSRAQAEARVNAALASVAGAETRRAARTVEAGQLEKAFLRNKLLHEKGNVADAELEETESAYLSAKHAAEAAATVVEVARFELDQARAALLPFDAMTNPGEQAEDRRLELSAPVDGVVLRVPDKSGRPVSAGEILLELGDPGDLEIRIDVLSEDAVKIRPGQKVIIEHWGGARSLEGVVRRVEPSGYTKVSALGVDEQRVDVIADFTSEPREGESLADGYRLEAAIVVWARSDAIQVPTGALFRDGSDWAAFEVESGRARLRKLELGRNNGEFAEVLSGLEEGDVVVLHPGDRVGEGTAVKARNR